MKNIKPGLIRILTILFIVILSVTVIGQQKQNSNKRPFKDRISVGGVLGFGFSSNSTLVDVSPVMAYGVTNEFFTGLGLTYKYYRYNDYYFNWDDSTYADQKSHMYGFSVFARYYLSKLEIPVLSSLFIHGEVEPLFFNQDYKMDLYGSYMDGWGNTYSKDNYQMSFTSVLFGGGIYQPVGNRSYMFLEVLWNFNEHYYTPYSNPRIRIGFWGGF